MNDTMHMPPVIDVRGTATPTFAEIEDVFASSAARQGGGAMALCIFEGGEKVLDLVSGSAETDSLFQVFSVSKAITAIALAYAAQRRLIDLDTPIAQVVPALDRPETDMITARMVLSHTSGISAVAQPLTLEELIGPRFEQSVTQADPLWVPGTAQGYGAFTFGALLDAFLKGATGENIATFVTRNIARPLGANFGLGVSGLRAKKVVPLEFAAPALRPREVQAMTQGDMIMDGAMAPLMANPPAFFANPDVIGAQWPAMSGVGTADGLARIMAAAIGAVKDVQLLEAAALVDMTTEQTNGWDRALLKHTRFGSGVELPHVHLPLFGPASFGHQGAGGSLVAADPDRGIAMAFLTNKPTPVLGASDQGNAIVAALRQHTETQ